MDIRLSEAYTQLHPSLPPPFHRKLTISFLTTATVLESCALSLSYKEYWFPGKFNIILSIPANDETLMHLNTLSRRYLVIEAPRTWIMIKTRPLIHTITIFLSSTYSLTVS